MSVSEDVFSVCDEEALAKSLEKKRSTSSNYRIEQMQSYGREGEKNMDDLLKIYIEKVDRDQNSLKEDIRESERRTEKRIQDSEKRMDKRLDKIEEMINSQNEKVENLGEKIADLDGAVRDRLEEHKRFLWGIAFSVILGIAGMIIAVIVAL